MGKELGHVLIKKISNIKLIQEKCLEILIIKKNTSFLFNKMPFHNSVDADKWLTTWSGDNTKWQYK